MYSALYSVVFGVNPVLCETLEVLLVWRLWRSGAFRRYPYLCGFVCYDLVRTPTLLLSHHFWAERFSLVYFATDASAQVWQFLVFCEIVRLLFLPDSGLRRIAWNAFLVVEGFALPAIVALICGQMSFASSLNSLLSVFEQYASLSQALLLLTLAALTRYYRVPVQRNVRAVVFSLGPDLLINGCAFASYQLFDNITTVHILEVIPAVAFSALMGVWLWAFWEYAPVAETRTVDFDAARIKAQWTGAWQATLSAVKRVQS